jgi:hypothetical protein
MLVHVAAGGSRVAQLGLAGSNRIVLLGVALAASSIAAFMFISRPFSLPLSNEEQAIRSSTIVFTSSDNADRMIEMQVLDFRKCGTYYLSLPEKCLIDGGYVSRFEFPSQPSAQRLAGLVRPAAVAVELPVVGIGEAQRQVEFKIPQPSWVPAGLTLQGAHVAPPNWAQIFYGLADASAGGMGIEINEGSKEGYYLYPDDAKQSVTIGGQTGVCVQGSWNDRQEWMASVDAGALEWSANGFSYHIGHFGLGLSCENLVRIAQLLK